MTFGSNVIANTPAAVTAKAPLLGTAEQIAAERQVLELLTDPEITLIQRQLQRELAATPRGQSQDGAATLDRAISMWTNACAMSEMVNARRTSTILWFTENTPRTWHGYTIGGFGVCGDTPDNIYRAAPLDSGGHYEVMGRFDHSNRPAQWVMEVTRTQPNTLEEKTLSKNKADMGNQISMMTDLDLSISPDGEFRVPVTATEPCQLLFRDSLSDWNQRPCQLSLRQLSGPAHVECGFDEIRQRIRAKLPEFIRFWSGYLDAWMGGPAPNRLIKPVARDRNWGFLGGFHYKLAPDEAIILRTIPGNAAYSSVQITDPWMMTADTRRFQNSMNRSQTMANANGSATYVLAAQDPGIANWLDTAGVHEGIGILRWQGTPSTTNGADLVQDMRVVKLADAARLSGLAHFSAEQRQVQMAARRASFETRNR